MLHAILHIFNSHKVGIDQRTESWARIWKTWLRALVPVLACRRSWDPSHHCHAMFPHPWQQCFAKHRRFEPCSNEKNKKGVVGGEEPLQLSFFLPTTRKQTLNTPSPSLRWWLYLCTASLKHWVLFYFPWLWYVPAFKGNVCVFSSDVCYTLFRSDHLEQGVCGENNKHFLTVSWNWKKQYEKRQLSYWFWSDGICLWVHSLRKATGSKIMVP